MLKNMLIDITIDFKKKELFMDRLMHHGISFNLSGGRHPRIVNNYYKEMGVIPCYFYTSPSENWNNFSKNKNNLEDPFIEHIVKNEFINIYLSQFYSLEALKDFFIEGSNLVLIFKGLIKHKDVIDLSRETINNLNKLGLGISYDHI